MHLSEEGYDVEIDSKTISCSVKKNLDSEKILHQRTFELFQKTDQLNKEY
jgi:hypothetical protein